MKRREAIKCFAVFGAEGLLRFGRDSKVFASGDFAAPLDGLEGYAARPLRQAFARREVSRYVVDKVSDMIKRGLDAAQNRQ